MNETDFETLKLLVLRELNACGYFHADFNVHGIKHKPDWKPYSSKSFGEMLMDFACLYNMEFENKNYIYQLKEEENEKLPGNI